MRQLTVTALSHPAMVARIRLAMRLAFLCRGDLMNGHGHRVYIPNRHGRNIMRLDWQPSQREFIVYGQESVNITGTIQRALMLANKKG